MLQVGQFTSHPLGTTGVQCKNSTVTAVQHAMGKIAQAIHQTSQESTSTCFSPLCIFSAILLVLEGMDEHQQAKVLNELGLSALGLKDVRSVSSQLVAQKPQGYTLGLANALAIGDPDSVHPEFIATARKEYNAEVFLCGQEPVEVCDKINKWVAKKTAEKIPQLLSEKDIPQELAAVLLNALYFSGTWSNKFLEHGTTPEAFHFADGTRSDVPMMHLFDERFKFVQDENHATLIMPFENKAGEDLKCVILMPNDEKRLHELESQMNLDFIQKNCEAAKFASLNLTFPKIDLDIKFGDITPLLGRFSIYKHASLPNIDERALLSSIIHQSNLKFDESGAEGTAATAALCELECCSMSSTKPISFAVDKPFAFAIMMGKTIVFQGSVKDPSAFPKAAAR